MKIYILDNSERGNWEAYSKGYRADVYIEIDVLFYQIFIYDNIRIMQDIASEFEEYNYYSVEPNIVIVKVVNIENILFTVSKLKSEGYFKKIKNIEIDVESLYKENPELLVLTID